MKAIYLSLLAFAFAVIAQAQISHGGEPANWDIPVPSDMVFESYDVNNLDAYHREDAILDEYKNIPFRFGVNIDVDLNSTEHGNWSTLPNGDRVWKLGMASRNALSLNFVMDEYYIPDGGQVFVYSEDKKQLLGSFTNENTSPENSLAIGLVFDDKVILEYREPANAIGQGYIHINQLTHGYRDFMGRVEDESKAGPFGDADACNVNVNCPEGLPFDIQKRSVAVIVRNGNGICSGALVNTTAQDERPYFLTANHCLGSSLNSWVFYFNHETPDCEGDETAPTDQSVSGATLLASNAESDFALLELNSDVPDSYNVCYSGWDATDLTSSVTSAYSIHHPRGDVKKICFEDDAPYHVDNHPAFFVEQVWFIDQWELGVTEGGSSGSPLFNQSGFLIGQLAGGSAACNGEVNNGQDDWYGRLGVSWDFGGSDNNSLESWLDPINSGQMIVPNSCAADAPDNDIFLAEFTDLEDVYCGLDAVSPSLSVFNMGQATVNSFSFSLSVNGGTAETFEVTGQNIEQFESVSVNLGEIDLVVGNNDLVAEVIDVNGEEDENEIGNSKEDETWAFDYTETVTVAITLDNYPEETSWEIVNNQGFVFASGGGYSDTTFEVEEEVCLGDGCYEFIIYDSYGDGICCSQGQGQFQVIAQDGSVYGEGGNFDDEDQVDFCIEANSVGENPLLKEISMFPNPTNDQVNIGFGALAGEVSEIRVMDAAGRIVKTIAGSSIASSEMVQLNTTDLTVGVYLVSIHTNDKGILTKRLMVAK